MTPITQTMRPNSRVGKPRGLMRLHLGCGTHVVPGWVNVDGSWNARLAHHPYLRRTIGALGLIPRKQAHLKWEGDLICHNLRRRLPFSDESVSCVYAAHVLEHLYHEDALRLLLECHRVSEAGGIVRMVVPDLRAMVTRYLARETNAPGADCDQPFTADDLNIALGFRMPSRPRGSAVYQVYTALTDFHSHKWMYDAESLCDLFQKTGFVDVGRRAPFDSRIPGIESVEQTGRTESGQGVCVEGIKT
jgi:hypothetical protein